MSDDKTIIAEPSHSTLFQNPARNAACLVQYNAQDIGKRYVLDQDQLVFGRAPNFAQVVVNDPSVSKRHAMFRLRGQTIEVEDLKSTNGTFVNERRMDQVAVLKDGDMVRLGTVVLKFFAHGNIENVFHDKIYRMATIDTTTQVFNKKYVLETLESEFRASKDYRRALTVIYYDLDFFKRVNDQHGHNAGDAILKLTAQIVRTAVRKNDIVGRVGGEEFVIILPDTDAQTGYELAERIREKIASRGFKLDSGQTVDQTLSLGVAQLTPAMQSPLELLEAADKNLYRSKKEGRNRVTM